MKVEIIKLIEGRDDVTLTTYVVNESVEYLPGRKKPAMIICPGGAYFSCADTEGEPVALAYASMGYHAFVLKYSVYGGNPFEMDMSKLPLKEECQYPASMRDIARAMLCIREHAEEWNVDVNKIGICGFSAGAHNCAMYETNWSKPVITDYFGKDKENFRPAVCVLGYCLSDYVFMKENTKDDPMAAEFFHGSNRAFLGEDQNDELLTKASPARNVDGDTPPTFLWATAEDNLVPVQHTIRMAHALADYHIPFEMHIFQDGPHGLSVATQASAGAKSQVYKDAAKWVGLCDEWLKKHIPLEMPEVTPFEELMHPTNK